MQSIAFKDLPVASFTATDLRAEGAARRVSIDRQAISIARRFMGIDMRVAVPVTAYVGVVLRRESLRCGGFEITLEHQDPELSVTLWRTECDEPSIESVWREWAAYLELPALCDAVQRSHDGASILPSKTRPVLRRLRSHRRPRFLRRRKAGVLDRTITVHRDEELSSYE